jgi:hypothetical protein
VQPLRSNAATADGNWTFRGTGNRSAAWWPRSPTSRPTASSRRLSPTARPRTTGNSSRTSPPSPTQTWRLSAATGTSSPACLMGAASWELQTARATHPRRRGRLSTAISVRQLRVPHLFQDSRFIRRILRHESRRVSAPYSPECVEGQFPNLALRGVSEVRIGGRPQRPEPGTSHL